MKRQLALQTIQVIVNTAVRETLEVMIEYRFFLWIIRVNLA